MTLSDELPLAAPPMMETAESAILSNLLSEIKAVTRLLPTLSPKPAVTLIPSPVMVAASLPWAPFIVFPLITTSTKLPPARCYHFQIP